MTQKQSFAGIVCDPQRIKDAQCVIELRFMDGSVTPVDTSKYEAIPLDFVAASHFVLMLLDAIRDCEPHLNDKERSCYTKTLAGRMRDIFGLVATADFLQSNDAHRTDLDFVTGHTAAILQHAQEMQVKLQQINAEFSTLRQIANVQCEMRNVLNMTLTDEQLAKLPEDQRKRLGLREI